MALHVTLDAVTATNAAYWTNPVTNPATGAELLAYVDYLGQALLRKVSFTVNGNPLDDYDSEVMNFHQKFNNGLCGYIIRSTIKLQEHPLLFNHVFFVNLLTKT